MGNPARPAFIPSIHSCGNPVKDPAAFTVRRPGEREDAIREEAKEGQAAQGVRAD